MLSATTIPRNATMLAVGSVVAALLAGAALPVRAEGDLLGRATAAVDQLQASAANDAPRVVRTDLGAVTPSSAALPGYRSEVNELGYRWWSSRGRADVGVGVGTVVESQRPLVGSGGTALRDDASIAHASGTILTLGLRYRTSEHSAFYANASGVRGIPGLNDDKALVGKVGVEFKSAQSRWNIAYGGLGLHLNGDTRMTLRVRKGGVAVYMRSKF